MKRLCVTFVKIFLLSAGLTQLILLIFDLAGSSILRRSSVTPLLYLCLILLTGTLVLRRSRMPAFDSRRISRLLRAEGYCPEVYAILLEWKDRCEKRGFGESAQLITAQMMIDGAHYRKGFELLGELDMSQLDRRQKQVCLNTWLYGAVLTGDMESADSIYSYAEPWLTAVTDKRFIPSVKHTLGCYEYMCGRKIRAEQLFTQSIDCAASHDVLCEDWLALSACYLDSGRNEQAKYAVEQAMRYSCTALLDQKIIRAKRLVENAYRERSV